MNSKKKETIKLLGVMVIMAALLVVTLEGRENREESSVNAEDEEIEVVVEEVEEDIFEGQLGAFLVDGKVYKPHRKLLGNTSNETKYETNKRTGNKEIVQMGQSVLNVSKDSFTILAGHSSEGPFEDIRLNVDDEILVIDYNGDRATYNVKESLDIDSRSEEDMNEYNDLLDAYTNKNAVVVVILDYPQKAFFAVSE